MRNQVGIEGEAANVRVVEEAAPSISTRKQVGIEGDAANVKAAEQADLRVWDELQFRKFGKGVSGKGIAGKGLGNGSNAGGENGGEKGSNGGAKKT